MYSKTTTPMDTSTSIDTTLKLDPVSQRNRLVLHVNPCDLIQMKANDWAMAPKADGIHQKGILNLITGDLEPFQSNPSEDYLKVYYEQIENFPPLIFNIYHKDIDHLDVVDKMNWLRVKMGLPEVNIDNWNSEVQIEPDCKWYPKPVFRVRNVPEALELLGLEYKTFFPNDGWVVINLKEDRCYKVKPLSHTTVDLRYRNGLWLDQQDYSYTLKNKYNIKPEEESIWRCYWEDEFWVPKNLRKDSYAPNHRKAVIFLTQAHTTHKFVPKMLLPYLDQFENFYYESNQINVPAEVQAYIKYQSANAMNTIKHLQLPPDSNWLDLGCGFGHKLVKILDHIKPKKLLGLDIDPKAIGSARFIYRQNENVDFLWTDLNKVPWSEIPWEDNKIEFDAQVIVSIFSWHYQERSKWLEMIEELCPSARYLIMKIIDCNTLKRYINGDQWEGPCGTKVTFLDKDKVSFKYPWKEKETIEPFIEWKTIVAQCRKFGWEVTWNHCVKVPQHLQDWKPLLESSRWLHFEKLKTKYDLVILCIFLFL